MSSTAPQAGESRGLAERLGIKPGMTVMELGYDAEDADEQLRDAVVEATGEELVGEDSDEVADMVMVWFREGDGDLVDLLVDASSPLDEDGAIWLLTPKVGMDGQVDPGDITESAPVAGLSQTSTRSVVPQWSGTRLARPKGDRNKR